MTWELPNTLVQAAIGSDPPMRLPKPADTLTDGSGTVWTITEREFDTLKSRWRCVTIDLILAFGLNTTLTLQKPQLTQDAASGRTYTAYTVLNSQVPARFQEVEDGVKDERGKRVTARRFNVWVGQRLYPTIECQVFDSGNPNFPYEVVGWRNADRIDELMMLECERRGW